MNDQSTLPAIEATIRTPHGEVRVWIDTEGVVRTSLRAELGDAPTEPFRTQVLAVVDQAVRAVRATFGCEPAAGGSTNHMADWLETRTVRGDGLRSLALPLYEDYLDWCKSRGARSLTMRQFGDALGDRGYVVVGKDQFGRKLRSGLRLRQADDLAAPSLRAVV